MVNGGEIQADIYGLTRREVIRKAGFCLMFALPVVSSLLAPTAVEAQSCIMEGNPAGSVAGPSGPTPCDCSANSGFCWPGAAAFPGTCF